MPNYEEKGFHARKTFYFIPADLCLASKRKIKRTVGSKIKQAKIWIMEEEIPFHEKKIQEP